MLYFQGVQMATGQHWYVPVLVAKGAKPGTHVVQVLHDSPDPKCDGDGCPAEDADYIE